MSLRPPTDPTHPTETPDLSGSALPDSLTVALPKGRLSEQTLAWFRHAGIPLPAADGSTGDDRRLILASEDGALRYVMAKPSDVPIYVEYGAADVGICGLDILREGGRHVYEPLLLPFGHCRLSLAGPADLLDVPLRYDSQPRVATKFPRLTEEFFRHARHQCRNHHPARIRRTWPAGGPG